MRAWIYRADQRSAPTTSSWHGMPFRQDAGNCRRRGGSGRRGV